MYFELRRRGKTIRSIIDILIALTALHHGLRLLHRDKDFDQITDVFKELALH
jgi:predicted nucleic acid-binding protein